MAIHIIIDHTCIANSAAMSRSNLPRLHATSSICHLTIQHGNATLVKLAISSCHMAIHITPRVPHHHANIAVSPCHVTMPLGLMPHGKPRHIDTWMPHDHNANSLATSALKCHVINAGGFRVFFFPEKIINPFFFFFCYIITKSRFVL